MPNDQDDIAFEDARRMSQSQLNNLSKRQLASAIADAAKFVECREKKFNKALTAAVSELKGKLVQQKIELSESERKLRFEMEGLHAKMTEMKTEMENRIFREIENRNSRRNNVIIFGLREPEVGDQTLDNDRKRIADMLKKMDCSENSIKKITRFGVKGGGPRPVRVVIESFDEKMKLLKATPRLSSYGNDNIYKNVFIKNDLTLKQLARERKLREELTRRQLSGEDVIIRQGRIVPRPSYSVRRLFRK